MSELGDVLIDAMEPDGAPSEQDILDLADDAPVVSDRLFWRPESGDEADWVARKAKRARGELDELQAQHDRLVAVAGAWLAHERKRPDATIEWASQMLELWLRNQIAEDDSKKPKKSRSLPAGVTVKLVSGRRRVQIDDPDAFVEWAEVNADDLLNVKVTADKSKLAKLEGDSQLVTADGEVVPGVSAEVGPDSVKVDLGGAS